MKNKDQDGRKKYSEIADAALKLFLENGYEATSMRMIASGVGCEPGLIYYYFRNKDEAFEKAFERLFDRFSDNGTLTAEYPKEPYAALYPLFRSFSKEVVRFRSEYGGRLHWTVKGAVKERALSALYGKVYDTVCRLKEYGTVAPADARAAAEFLTYGIGNAIIAGDMTGEYADGLAGCAEAVLRPSSGQKNAFVPCLAAATEEIEGLFPALGSTGVNHDMISERVAAREVFIVGNGNKVIGAAVFSRVRKSVDYLAVLPEYRRIGVGTRLVAAVIGEFSPGDTVTAAFGDYRQLACRLYAGLGFTERRTAGPFGTEIICMTLRIPKQQGEKE